jgi:molybdopterin converting factor small subunit
MTENEYKLLVVFEDRMREFIRLYGEKKHHIDDLKKSLKEKDEIIRQNKQTIEALQAKYTTLHTACRLADDEGEFQNVRKRVDKLVRELGICIDLIKE